MKAIVLHNKGDADQLKFEEVETPKINDDEVLVKVKAASVNHLDVWVRMGHFPVSYPVILGCEGAGDIAEIGKNVTLFQGVSLGGTGKEKGKRHPTLCDNVVVGAGAKLLGNIRVGENTRIGAGSVVVESVPPNSTAVGVPAEVVRQEKAYAGELNLDHGDLPDPLEALRARVGSLQKELEVMESELRNFRNSEKKK